ncbi:unnamed protein product [Caenorhabditis angaria]|uniref:Serpentine receptor class r-10 n=1 Tax=Caenorhabditis angaria TaxID=860376 RepID=A0A9P1IW85_9PELO|nr:unnamed protein product [Caenorhabditis angaria]
MEPSNLLTYVTIFDTIGLILSLSANSILLILIKYRSRASFGAYKYLMMSYAFVEVLYSLSAFSSKTSAHSTNTSYVLFRIYNGPNRTIGPAFQLQFCTMYTVLIVILVVHFIYRYIAICRTQSLKLFQGHKLYLWVAACFGVGLFVGVMKYFLLGESEEATELLRPEFLKWYNLTMDQVCYNGPIYYVCDKNNENCYTPLKTAVAMSFINSALVFFFIVMTYFGWKSYSQLKVPDVTLSQRTRQLQQQLLTALIIQSAIPSLFMYFPVGLLFMSPIFGVGFGAYANLSILSLAIYPPLDQIAIVYVIKDFRVAIKDFMSGKRSGRVAIYDTSRKSSTKINS